MLPGNEWPGCHGVARSVRGRDSAGNVSERSLRSSHRITCTPHGKQSCQCVSGVACPTCGVVSCSRLVAANAGQERQSRRAGLLQRHCELRSPLSF